MPGGKRLEIGARPAHHRLMVIVAQRISVGELTEVGRVAGGHVVEAHRDGTLVGAGERVGTV